MNRKGWLTPILVFIICISFLLTYQAKQGGTSLARTVDAPLSPWNIDISHINQIEFKEANKIITAVFNDTGWQLLEYAKLPLDATYLYNILFNFSNPQLLEEVTTDIADLTKYGIDKFSKSITLYDASLSKYELICGKEASDSTYYVYSPTTNTVYTMHKEAFDSLSYNLSTWRSKDYLNFNADTTSKIKIYTPTGTFVLEAATVNNTSTFTSPNLSQEHIDTIINFLNTTRITTFIVDEASPSVVINYGFDNPLVKISIFNADGQVTTFSINPSPDQRDQSYVMLENENSIFAISSF